MAVLPAPSSATLACARLHWPVADVGLVTLGDGLVPRVIRYLQPGRRLIVFSRDETTPAKVAKVLLDQGYGPSRLVILEHLGGTRERVVPTTAERFGPGPVARLNLLAIECATAPGVYPLSVSPGLPDDAFENDGMLTRSEVRALTLARLQPARGERLLDVGAGSGSIAIEWLRAAGEGSAVAVERDPKRCAIIRRNALALGAPEVEVVEDEAPQCLEGLPAADAVFIGGGLTRDGLLAACLGKLRPGGRLVANAVTLEGEQALIGFRAEHGGGLVRLALSCLEPVGRLHGWRPAMPVTQLTFVR
jgi:precorrin-6Y C5,15-methyltransferase (decarboxylating)